MKEFGLIGFPLTHSFSKKYFSAKFEIEQIEAVYELYELAQIEEFTALINRIELSGLNVTIPYKEQIIPYLDSLDETAEKIGAVNVIKFIRASNQLILKGYNSDASGFEQSLKPYLKPHHQKALILGTGGASKAIHYVLEKLGIEVTFVSRTPQSGQLTYSDLNQAIMQEHLVVINASPVGTFPHTNECPAIPYDFIAVKHLLFDVVYNPAETLFLKKAKEQGAATLNGEEMLQGQARAAWKIWNDKI